MEREIQSGEVCMTNSNEDVSTDTLPLNKTTLEHMRIVNIASVMCALYEHRMKLKSCRVCNPNKELGGQ